MDKTQVLEAIDQVFGSASRPKHFLTNPNHCCECQEHEETLQGVTPETITLKEVGSHGWDPLCGTTPDAFQYFMPGLARLAFGKGDNYYLDSLLFHLESLQLDHFDKAQKEAVLNLLWFLYETMPDEIDKTVRGDCDMSRVIDKLEEKYGGGDHPMENN
jgi:hypothetical protein